MKNRESPPADARTTHATRRPDAIRPQLAFAHGGGAVISRSTQWRWVRNEEHTERDVDGAMIELIDREWSSGNARCAVASSAVAFAAVRTGAK
jgi:hypothetical protein